MFLLRRFASKSHRAPDANQNDGNFYSSYSYGFMDEEAPRKALGQASDYVTEGRYERALWLLEKLGLVHPDVKGVAELVAVAQVCHAAVSRPCPCFFRQRRSPDWYKILKVDDNSDLEMIKKKYRQLALLLHPDKNKHVKAEGAFKLVSEAYACLSDKKKRENFNIERSLLQCRQCSQVGSAVQAPERWSVYECSREQNTKLWRPSSVPDLTEADWVLEQQKLKMFRERARARVLSNLAMAWKERRSKWMEQFDSAIERSHGRKMDRKVWGDKEAASSSSKCQQQGVNIKEHKMNKMGAATENPILSFPAPTNIIQGLYESHSSSKIDERSRNGVVSVHETLRHGKNLRVLIRDLRAELNAHIDSPCSSRSACEELIQEEPLAGNVDQTDSKAANEMGYRFVESAKTLHSMQESQREGDCGCKAQVYHSKGACSEASESHNSIFSESSAQEKASQETAFCAEQNWPPSFTNVYSDLHDTMKKHPSELDHKVINDVLSSHPSSTILLSITNRLQQTGNGTTSTVGNKRHSDFTEGKRSDSYKSDCAFLKGRKSAGENNISGVSSSVGDSFFGSFLKQRSKGTERNYLDQDSSPTSIACDETISKRRVRRGDSLDMEETILQTQKEKSEQLLETLQRLREETKSVAANLHHICDTRGLEAEGGPFQNFPIALPSYQTFLWEMDR